MYKVDVANQTIQRLKKTTFFNERLRERYDIQEWVEKNPEIIGGIINRERGAFAIGY